MTVPKRLSKSAVLRRLLFPLLCLLLGVAVPFAVVGAAPRNNHYPRHATVISPGDAHPSFRFYQEANDNTIAYDYSYNNGQTWTYGGNLGGYSLTGGESIAATYLEDRLIVLITNNSNGRRYFKQSQLDAWGTSVQGFTPYWVELPRP